MAEHSEHSEKWRLLTALATFFVLHSASAQSVQPSYVVVVPQIVRANSTFDISVTILRATGGVTVTAALQDKLSNSIAVNSASLNTGATTTISLQIPAVLSQWSYRVVVNGSGGLSFSRSDVVDVKQKTLSILIQTDKPVYKPGQNVLFRMIFMKPDLKPFDGTFNVTVHDGQRVVGQWNNQNTTAGVYSNYLQLSDQASLGAWRISVKIQGTMNNASKTFTVANCVSPAFSVQINVPRYHIIRQFHRELQQDLPIVVTAVTDPRGPLGTPVEGTALIRVRIGCCYDVGLFITRSYSVQLRNGSAQISLNMSDFRSLIYYVPPYNSSDQAYLLGTVLPLYGVPFQVFANVTETVSALIVNASTIFYTTSMKYKLEFLDMSPTVYKSGLPFYLYIQLRQQNGSAPDAADIQSQQIDIKLAYNGQLLKSVPIPHSGLIMTSVVIGILVTHSQFYLRAEFVDSAYSNSTLSAYLSLERFTSCDNESIQVYLDSNNGIAQTEAPIAFTVNTSKPITTVFYQLLSKDRLITGGKRDFTASTVNRLTISVDASTGRQMIPSSRLIVWYITTAGEIVSDSLDFSVNSSFLNQVSATFSASPVRPSTPVNISVSAQPQSFVGLLAVDSRVERQTDNDISSESVLQDLSTYDTRSAHWDRYMFLAKRRRRAVCFGCSGGWDLPYVTGGKESAETFELAGVTVLTDAYLYVTPSRSSYNWPRRTRYGVSAATGAWTGPRMDPIFPSPVSAIIAPLPVTDEIVPVDPLSAADNCPVTWLWTNVTTGADGRATVEATTPDSNSIWSLSAFSISPQYGLGLMQNPAKLKVFSSFHVSLHAPRSIVRGEEFAVRVVVYNYRDTLVQVNVTMKRSELFKVRYSNTAEPSNTALSSIVQVAGGQSVTTFFWIVAKSLGEIIINIDAFSAIDVQFTQAVIFVRPEGIPQTYSTSVYISITTGQTFNYGFNVSLPGPGILVNDTANITVTVTGDILCKTILGLAALIRLPYGCGEQTMLSFAPNVYILIYLQISVQLTNTISSTAIAYTIAGYQRELTFQRTDASFSAFGQSDASGSVWLSAFVIKCFHEARSYTGVSDAELSRTLSWLVGYQNPTTGAFTEPGRVLHRELQGGSSNGAALTAYVLIALLENSDNTVYNSVAAQTRAIQYLVSQLLLPEVANNPYALSIITYALALSDPFGSNANTSLQKLEALATNTGGLRYWKTASTASGWQPWTPPYSAGRPFDIELNAYALLTYTLRRDLISATSVAKWIMSQQNPFGGFTSTQDTVIGLQALSRFAVLTGSASAGDSLTVSLTASSSFNRQVIVNRANALTVQTVQIPADASRVDITASGAGVAIVQLTATYNVLVNRTTTTRQKRATAVNPLPVNVTQQQFNTTAITITACTAWLGNTSSGMSMLEISLPTGYEAVNADGLRLQAADVIKLVENNVEDGVVVIYMDGLSARGVCVNLVVSQVMMVANVKPASVKAYLYYEPAQENLHVYEPIISSQLNLCDQCPQCCQSQPVSYFRCPDGAWLDSSAVCNGVRDCSDGSDEVNCPATTTKRGPTSGAEVYSNNQLLITLLMYVLCLLLATSTL